MKSITALVSIAALVTPGLSQEIVLGAASSYAVVAVAGITNTGNTAITGNIGTIDRGISGFPPGVFTGSEADPNTTSEAHADAVAAWTAARNLTATTHLTVAEASFNDVTLTPGVYAAQQGASIDNTLTLDGNGTFVFQIPSQLATVDNSQVVLTGGALAENVFWTMGSEIVLGANSTIVGSLVTDSEIILGAGAIVHGGIFAGASVTLVENTITAHFDGRNQALEYLPGPF